MSRTRTPDDEAARYVRAFRHHARLKEQSLNEGDRAEFRKLVASELSRFAAELKPPKKAPKPKLDPKPELVANDTEPPPDTSPADESSG